MKVLLFPVLLPIPALLPTKVFWTPPVLLVPALSPTKVL
jgi:hypothetical protein